MESIRPVLKELERRIIPYTSYPFAKSNSARYDPSWPVMPVIRAFFFFLIFFLQGETLLLHGVFLSTKRSKEKPQRSIEDTSNSFLFTKVWSAIYKRFTQTLPKTASFRVRGGDPIPSPHAPWVLQKRLDFLPLCHHSTYSERSRGTRGTRN